MTETRNDRVALRRHEVDGFVVFRQNTAAMLTYETERQEVDGLPGGFDLFPVFAEPLPTNTNKLVFKAVQPTATAPSCAGSKHPSRAPPSQNTQHRN